jgi:hypothetical protein
MIDWNSFYGFERSPDLIAFRKKLRMGAEQDRDLYQECGGEPRDFLSRIQRNGSAKHMVLAEFTDLCIFNLDGGMWHLYSRDPDYRDLVKDHLDRAGMRVESAVLEHIAW